MKFNSRHQQVARQIHKYFHEKSPGVKYLQWDKMTDMQRQWWLCCAVTALQKDKKSEGDVI